MARVVIQVLGLPAGTVEWPEEAASPTFLKRLDNEFLGVGFHALCRSSGVIQCIHMTPSTKKQTAFRIDSEILDGLRRVKERDGIPLAEQVRRALQVWLKGKGVTTTARKRASSRKRTIIRGGA
jgi:hypothetical protein